MLKKVIAGAVTLVIVVVGVLIYRDYAGRQMHVVDFENTENTIINEKDKEKVILPPEVEVQQDLAENVEEGEVILTALADTQEEAEKIADLYGIELKAYSYGVATYVTDKDPEAVIAEGIEKGYPTLAVDQKIYLEKE